MIIEFFLTYTNQILIFALYIDLVFELILQDPVWSIYIDQESTDVIK